MNIVEPTPLPVAPPPSIALTLRQFLTTPACPPRWKQYDLYLVRSDAAPLEAPHQETVVFYAGQSYCAFDRVWEHIYNGPKARSALGRFLLANWPRSAGFIVELLWSGGPRFAGVNHDLDAAERAIIEECRPCFNVALNGQPTPLPEGLLPPNTRVRGLRSLKRMLREAAYPLPASADDVIW